MTPNQSIQVTDYLTWESCDDVNFEFECPAPTPSSHHLPTWIKELGGNLREYLPEGFAQDQTIRHCMGFRGLMDIGYTIPLPETVGGGDSYFCRGRLHPEMVHGTPWAAQGGGPWADPTCASGFDTSPYQYRVKLLIWPWRAKMAPGWRMLVLPNLWDWSADFNSFSGAQVANYKISGNSIGTACNWGLPIDPNYNYYNIETVMAIRRDRQVPAGSITFTAVPIYQP